MCCRSPSVTCVVMLFELHFLHRGLLLRAGKGSIECMVYLLNTTAMASLRMFVKVFYDYINQLLIRHITRGAETLREQVCHTVK